MTNWRGFLDRFHRARAGITERVLRAGPEDPYAWLAAASPHAEGPVLDLACGSGPLAEFFPQWVGVDTSPAELELAADRAPGRLVRADAGALPFASGSMAAVVSAMALQVITPLPIVLAEARRVLRPGGTLTAMVPASMPLGWRDRWRWARLFRALRIIRPPFPNAPADIAVGLDSAGFAVVGEMARRFRFPVVDAAAAELLVESLYLPEVPDSRLHAARRIAARWTGSELGMPLRLLVARAPADDEAGKTSAGDR
ncbi:MAG TPA: class I SAM-dependent methyltransferase [Cryptosporangiaceae bacterium]|nr:class I SAM-dependent methyltransferase [Cryptosporangiaceae bacterium]